MPEITLSGPALQWLQRALRDAGHEAPDDIPDSQTLLDEGRISDPEQYPHEVAEESALYDILNACPVCGDSECDRGVAYIGASMIHADKHPERRAERGRERRAERHFNSLRRDDR